MGGALELFGSLTTFAFGLVVAVFVPLYLTAMPEPVVNWALRLFPPNHKPRAREVLSIMRASLLRWLKGWLLSMAMVGLLWTVALYLIGIPGALFLGILAGLAARVRALRWAGHLHRAASSARSRRRLDGCTVGSTLLPAHPTG